MLERAELGATTFHPVELFKFNRTSRVEGEYFCVAFRETKNSLVPDLSPLLRKMPGRKIDTWAPPHVPKDYDITLGSEALTGSELWMEQHLERAFFLSDRLVQILKEEKLTRRLGLRRCLIASDALN